MKRLVVRTLVIGSGFSGRTVALYLGEGDLIIERGELRSHGEMQRRYNSLKEEDKPYWQNARHAYRSDLPFNNVYVAGTALIPRLGAPNPTLTAVALSMMLGEQLALRN